MPRYHAVIRHAVADTITAMFAFFIRHGTLLLLLVDMPLFHARADARCCLSPLAAYAIAMLMIFSARFAIMLSR